MDIPELPELPELADFILKVIGKEEYVGWGLKNCPYGAYGDWVLTPDEHRGYPFTFAEALKTIPVVKRLTVEDFEIIPRKKSQVTLVKA